MTLWHSIGLDDEYSESTQAISMIPHLHEQIRLSRTTEKIIPTLFSPRSSSESVSSQVYLDS
ncbi:hypothetical protein EsH8_X_000556 [Colletotrichum jinshuiense]